MAPATRWRVPVGDADVTAVLDRATNAGAGEAFVFAHGAGGHLDDRAMLALAPRLCALGFDVVRFNFPYTEKRERRPDPMPVVMRCIADVCAHVRREIAPSRLIIGGRSMGGRAASMLAADAFTCDALLLFAYPLHPVGKPEQLRDAHLARIRAPVLCINGTRDALCRRDLMEQVVARLAGNWTMHWLDGADHSFHVTKASGRSDADVLDEVALATARWVSRLRGSSFCLPNTPG